MLGDTVGSANATFAILAGQTNFTTNITVQANSTGGSATLTELSAPSSNANNLVFGDVQYKGLSVTLNNNLTLQSIANSTLYLGFNSSTVVSGTWGITIAGPGRAGFASNSANTYLGTITVNALATLVTGDGAGHGGFNNSLGNAANAVTMGNNSALGIFSGGGTNTHNFTVGSGVVWSPMAMAATLDSTAPSPTAATA